MVRSLHSELARTAGDVFGLTEANAAELAQMITAWIQSRYGARRVYVHARSRQERDRAVVAAFNGQNRDQVCRDFGISETTLYRILDRAR